VIRTLRELDVDLATIGRVLRGATGLRATAELHVTTLEHQAGLIRRRVAVLRASLRHAGELEASRIQRLHALARLERAEKARFIGEQLGKRMAASGPPALAAARDFSTRRASSCPTMRRWSSSMPGSSSPSWCPTTPSWSTIARSRR
jgi:transposase